MSYAHTDTHYTEKLVQLLVDPSLCLSYLAKTLSTEEYDRQPFLHAPQRLVNLESLSRSSPPTKASVAIVASVDS